MKEQLIEFKTAVLAKEKGFNIRVKPFYNGLQDNKLEVSDIIDSSNQLSNWYPAPTQSLLQKWLRDIHHLHIDIRNNIGSKGAYFFTIMETREPFHTKLSSNEYFNTYEEALEKGLYQALKLIK